MRQLILQKNQDKNGLVLVDGKDFHYLRQVLRVKVGDMVKLRLADGLPYDSTVCKIDDSSKKITLQICAALRQAQGVGRSATFTSLQSKLADNSFKIEFSLFQFIPKPQKLELIVRQATECGVKNIIPVISEYAQKGSVEALSGKKIERLERIVREARQQSGSPIETKVLEPVTVEGAVDLWNKMKEDAGGEEESAGFVLSERTVAPSTGSGTAAFISGTEATPHIVSIFCGNEGGISPDELELLTKKGLLQPVHFSVNILRCETAALYGIAAIQTAIFGI